MKQENKGQKDSLTSIEWRVYQVICWICVLGALSAVYLFYLNHNLFQYTIFIEAIFLAVGYVFGYGLKNDIRVFDLRRFGGGD